MGVGKKFRPNVTKVLTDSARGSGAPAPPDEHGNRAQRRAWAKLAKRGKGKHDG